MIKFFRKIRQKLLSENRFSKYILYAIGEIVLVVIGILIALQVNNWNTKRNEQNEIRNYFVKMRKEISEIEIYFKSIDTSLDSQYNTHKLNLSYLKSKNRDSLYLLKNTIGILASNLTTNFSSPLMDEFFEKGLLSKVQNDSIKLYLEGFKVMSNYLESYDNYLDAQYVNAIEPFFTQHINYSEVTGRRRKLIIPDGPKTDFAKFQGNLELWNLITFKIEAIEVHKQRLKASLLTLDGLDNNLKKELND